MNSRQKGIIAIATGGFSGYFPVAPGTAGSALAAVILWAVGGMPLALHLALAAGLLYVGARASEQAQTIFRKKDSSRIVIDEIVGMLVTMIGIPFTGYWVVIGFLVFRFFDITKPPPARLFDSKFHDGWGVMLDDVVAGVYGNIILQLMLRASL